MAVTYDVTPANGGANAVGTLETTAQIQAYIISLDSDSDGTDDAPIDLAANDGASGSLYDLILRELSPMLAFAPNGSTGVMHIVMDGHHNTAASVKARLVALDGVGTDTTVAAASSFTVA